MRIVAAVGLVGLVGCGAGVVSGDDVPPYVQTLPSGPCSREGVTGTLAGVTLAIRSDSCVFRRGQPAHFTYEVAVDATVPPLVVPSSGTGCGACGRPSTEPISWVNWRIAGSSPAGEAQQYCLCDGGCCAPTPERTVRPDVATAVATIDWSGRTWNGPSDTNQPQGDYFLPGRYAVSVTFFGFASGEVRAELPIEVVAP